MNAVMKYQVTLMQGIPWGSE